MILPHCACSSLIPVRIQDMCSDRSPFAASSAFVKLKETSARPAPIRVVWVWIIVIVIVIKLTFLLVHCLVYLGPYTSCAECVLLNLDPLVNVLLSDWSRERLSKASLVSMRPIQARSSFAVRNSGIRINFFQFESIIRLSRTSWRWEADIPLTNPATLSNSDQSISRTSPSTWPAPDNEVQWELPKALQDMGIQMKLPNCPNNIKVRQVQKVTKTKSILVVYNPLAEDIIYQQNCLLLNVGSRSDLFQSLRHGVVNIHLPEKCKILQMKIIKYLSLAWKLTTLWGTKHPWRAQAVAPMPVASQSFSFLPSLEALWCRRRLRSVGGTRVSWSGLSVGLREEWNVSSLGEYGALWIPVIVS